MSIILIGIDDTDNPASDGTGKLARRLAEEIGQAGGRLLGTTGHQFFIDPAIPYTGHNRGICIGVDWVGKPAELDFAFDRIREWSAEGSDPGVCIGLREKVGAEVVRWGERASDTVLTMESCVRRARESGLDLRALGGTGQGIIGALASVGLRAGGESGRFVDMPGLRELGETVTAEQLAAMGIHLEHVRSSGMMAEGAEGIYRTLGWVRPRLCGGRAILAVQWSNDHGAWIPVDRKKVHLDAGGF